MRPQCERYEEFLKRWTEEFEGITNSCGKRGHKSCKCTVGHSLRLIPQHQNRC